MPTRLTRDNFGQFAAEVIRMFDGKSISRNNRPKTDGIYRVTLESEAGSPSRGLKIHFAGDAYSWDIYEPERGTPAGTFSFHPRLLVMELVMPDPDQRGRFFTVDEEIILLRP